MAFILKLKPKAEKELDKLEETNRIKAFQVLRDIKQDPFSGKKLDGRYAGQYSVYSWPFRIIYEIKKKELVVLVVKIKHRKDAYK